jgi:hypothetical protein
MPAPQYRKKNAKKKKALLVSSSAAPGILARLMFSTHGQLKTTARVIGAKPVGTIFTGLVASSPKPQLSDKVVNTIKTRAIKLTG